MSGFFSTVIRKRREYRKNQALTRPQLEALQLEKFRRLAQHACRHSPYYRQIAEERKIDPGSCSPADFPVLTKQLLLEHFDDILTDRRINKRVISDFLSRSTDPDELLLGRYHVLHTSGTTGQVGFFVFSEAEWVCGLMQGRRRRRENLGRIGFRRRRVAYYAAVGGHFAGVSMMGLLRRGIMKWLVDLSLNDVNDPLSKVIADLNDFQPDVLCGYTASLKSLAEKQLSGELRISPVAIGTGGEGQSIADRELFLRVWGCEAGNSYGCTEHLMMGNSRPDGRTMELYDDDLIYEFHDDHSLITNLFNYTLPLIRHRMTDIFYPVENDRSAEPYLLMKSIVGREEHNPWFTNREGVDEMLSTAWIYDLFIPGVSRFQMRLLGKTRFQFALCLEQSLDDAGRMAAVTTTRSRLGEILAQKQMENVGFDVVVEDELPTNPKTGKFDLIVLQAGESAV